MALRTGAHGIGIVGAAAFARVKGIPSIAEIYVCRLAAFVAVERAASQNPDSISPFKFISTLVALDFVYSSHNVFFRFEDGAQGAHCCLCLINERSPVFIVLGGSAFAFSDNKLTYNAYGKGKANQIDHFFVRKLRPLAFRTLDGDYGVPYVSDHYPVMMSFVF